VSATERESVAGGTVVVWIDAGHLDWEADARGDNDLASDLSEDIDDAVRLGLTAIRDGLREKYPELNLNVTYADVPLRESV
jgi:hypothetical protein